MVASEDLEPGDGWDYSFLGIFNRQPDMDGAELGKVIVDSFIAFFPDDTDEILTLSVVDLARVQPVMDAMGRLMGAARYKLADIEGFRTLAARRGYTKTFGDGSPRDNYTDMVDIGDMAVLLSDLFPREAGAVMDALGDAVLYNRHNADVPLYGLSAFYIYGGKSEGEASLRTYVDLGMDNYFTRYLLDFFTALVRDGGDATLREKNILRGHLLGHTVSLYPAGGNKKSPHYAIPVMVNGRDADIIAAVCRHSGRSHIMGARQRDGYVKQKGYDPICAGDVISFYSMEWCDETGGVKWQQGRPVEVRTPLQLQWVASPHRFESLNGYTPSAHQRRAFFNNARYWGLCQTARVWPGVSTHTRPLPRSSVYPAARTYAGALKYGSLSYLSGLPWAAA
jgi:hypothetical protein